MAESQVKLRKLGQIPNRPVVLKLLLFERVTWEVFKKKLFVTLKRQRFLRISKA